MLLLFAFIPFSGLLAQTNTLSGSLINGPGSSSQAIPNRTIKLEFYSPSNGEDPPLYSAQTTNTSSNDYSFTYYGGPIFAYDDARVFVDLDSVPNPTPDLLCVNSYDRGLIAAYLSSGGSLTNIQKVAADVNIDGVVSLADYNMMNDLLLGNISSFDNSLTVAGNTYQDLNIVYPTTAEVDVAGSPLPYDATYDYAGLSIPSGTTTGVDFYSVRLGDVSGNCTTYSQFWDGGGTIENKTLRSKEDHTIYPSPFEDSFSISLGNRAVKKAALLNLNGQEIITVAVNDNRSTLEFNSPVISRLPPGTYILRIVNSDGTIDARKILKQ